MPSESPRIAELRRRVEADPTSIAFAQLAEEYRRSGNFAAAEQCCRTGLTRHPSYLSARVTLGRTLIELDKLEEAESELNFVLKSAPDNLAAIRGMAEIHQRHGNLELALDFYRRALPLARHDPEIEENVRKINRDLGTKKLSEAPGLSFKEAQDEFLNALNQLPSMNPAAAPPVVAAAAPAPAASAFAPVEIQAPAVPEPEGAIDFDSLLKSLGVPDHQAPPGVEALLTEPAAPAVRPEPVLPELPLNPDIEDRFADLERGLRDFDLPAAAPEGAAAASEPLGYGEVSFDTEPAYGEAPAEPAVPYGERFFEENTEPTPAPIPEPQPEPKPEPMAVAAAVAAAEPLSREDAPAPGGDGNEQHILDELEAWLAAIKR